MLAKSKTKKTRQLKHDDTQPKTVEQWSPGLSVRSDIRAGQCEAAADAAPAIVAPLAPVCPRCALR